MIVDSGGNQCWRTMHRKRQILNDPPTDPHDDVADAILEHLHRFPNAQDSASGVRDWWLPPDLQNTPLPEVERALRQLVEDGHLVRLRSASGESLYAKRR